ncbi:hypothetical protein V2J09_004790 [Rumex salicifolius]
MENPNFRWKSDGTQPPHETLTRRFRLSAEQAPRLSEVQSPDDVPLPVIDMAAADDDTLASDVARASEEFGFFIVTNHGIPEEVWRRAAESVRDVFMLRHEIKSQFPGDEAPIDAVRLFNYYLNDWPDDRRADMWSENLNHVWHPVNDFTGGFPQELSAGYRENVDAYAKEMGVLMTRLLRLLSKGLGLQDDYLEKRLGDQPYYKAVGNYFPPCPEPDHAIGLPIHSDSLVLGVVRSIDEVPGLQIIKGERDWVGVRQLPNSFVVNIGDQLEVLSNKRYLSVRHRVVTNKSPERVSLAYFCGPDFNATINPIEELIDDDHPLVYKSYKYKEYIEMHEKLKGKRRKVKEAFLVKPPDNLEDLP